MSHDFVLHAGRCRRPGRRWLPAGLLALAAMVAPVSLLAGEAAQATGANVIRTLPDAISSMSGGVGDEARAEMRRAAGDYNVHVLFSGRGGAYLAGIPYTVADGDGRIIHSGVSEGPLLYLKLRPGSYRIAAELDGVSQDKRIAVAAAGHPAELSFVGKGD